MSTISKVALFIDADNARPRHLAELLSKLESYGKVCIKRAFGNWENATLNPWKEVLIKNAIEPIQHFDLTKHKNATDIGMVINVMDFVYQRDLDKENYTTIAFMSSDCDFTPLVMRIRQDGINVICAGESKTPLALQDAATNFILLSSEDSSRKAITNSKDTSTSITAKVVDVVKVDNDQKGKVKTVTTSATIPKAKAKTANLQKQKLKLSSGEAKIKQRMSASLANKNIEAYIRKNKDSYGWVSIKEMVADLKIKPINNVDYIKVISFILNTRSRYIVTANYKDIKIK